MKSIYLVLINFLFSQAYVEITAFYTDLFKSSETI